MGVYQNRKKRFSQRNGMVAVREKLQVDGGARNVIRDEWGVNKLTIMFQFSDILVISNSVTRPIGAMDASSEPAITSLLLRLRPGWVNSCDEFLLRQTAADVQTQYEKSSITNKTFNCDFILKTTWDNGLW